MLTNERCFELWAPEASPWSAWAKPVLFSEMDRVALRPASAGIAPELVDQLPAFDAATALVVDLNGRDAVGAGLALALKGWRPVPLFNATTAPKALVDVVPIMEVLLGGAEALQEMTVRDDAPPAFLLDARRMNGSPAPGDYDNRSITLPQDFPSATFLRSRGIRTALLIQLGANRAKDDLDHVLLRWQQGGIALRSKDLKGMTYDLEVSPPSMFRKGWYRLIVLLGLRRSNVGGFGAMVPEQTSGGGFG